MRARSVLISWAFINLWLGISLVLAPSRLRVSARTLFAVVLDYSYGSGFLLAALLCLVAALLWSRHMQRRVPIRLIRLARLGALGASFSVMLALVMIEIIAVFFLGGNILTVGFVAGMAAMEALAINEADLTPVRESYLWQTSAKGG